MTGRVSTGIDVLDQKLDGGIPSGRIVVLSASPASQAELLLYEFASVRPTVYLATERSESAVRDAIERAGVSVDSISIYRIEPDDPIARTRHLTRDLSDRSTVVLDTVRPFERLPEDDYIEVLNDLKSRIDETGSVAILHCLDGRDVVPVRTLTEYFADIVFHLSTTVSGETVENSLTIPKFRGGQALADAIKLDLTAQVTIDVSRKIA